MQRDRWNRPETSANFGNPEFTPVEWDDTTTEGVVYCRGDYDDVCVIQKVSETKIEWAYGAWADRATLVYGDDRIRRV